MKIITLPTPKNLKNAISKLNQKHKWTTGHLKNIEICIKNKKIKISHKKTDLKSYDFVWLSSSWPSRDIAYIVKKYLEYSNIPHSFVEKAGSKLVDCMLFAINNIPLPNTFYCSKTKLKQNIKQLEDCCSYPLIIKDSKGYGGKLSQLIYNRRQFLKTTLNLPNHKKFIYQKFIPNEYDWGVLINNNQVVAAEKSYPKKGEFRNNACNGAKEVFVNTKQVPQEIKNIAIRASKVLGLEWSRSDIIVDKNTQKPYLLEVNRFPGISKGTDEVKAAHQFLSSKLKTITTSKTPNP